MEAPEGSITLSSFTCFPRLAPDIRLKIWRVVVLKPRVLEVELDAEDGLWHSPTPPSRVIPATLHAYHESRQEALKIYERMSFGPWINFLVDTIYIRDFMSKDITTFNFESKFLEWLRSDPIIKKLRFLALSSYVWSEGDGSPHYRYMVLEALPKLTVLSIIWGDDAGNNGGDFSYWKGSEVIFEDFSSHAKLSNTETRNREYERRLSYPAGRHYLSYSPPEFKFPEVRRHRPAIG